MTCVLHRGLTHAGLIGGNDETRSPRGIEKRGDEMGSLTGKCGVNKRKGGTGCMFPSMD